MYTGMKAKFLSIYQIYVKDAQHTFSDKLTKIIKAIFLKHLIFFKSIGGKEREREKDCDPKHVIAFP